MSEAKDLLLREKGFGFSGAITASLSHEINNVFAIINELSGLLEDFLLVDDEQVFVETLAMRLGAMDLVEKPVEIEVLVEKIEEAATNRMQLNEQQMDKKLSDFLRKKGW